MKVAIIMGSTSDLAKVEPAIEILRKYDVITDVRVYQLIEHMKNLWNLLMK